jgi:HK97 gp10 family phage protein
MEDEEVKITGLVELQDALEQLPYRVAKKGLKASLHDAAAPVEASMVREAPKESGFLAEHFSTKISIARDQLSGSAFIGPKGKVDYPAFMSGAYRIVRNAKGRAVKVGRVAVATVARFLEFGTSRMGKNPFMRRAWETTKGTALDAMIKRLASVVEEAADESPKGPEVLP